MRTVPETYAKQDWPRKVARTLNRMVTLYNTGQLGGGSAGSSFDLGDSGPTGGGSMDMGEST